VDKIQAFESIARDVASGAVEFSTDARVTLRLRDALSDPECHAEAAARLVQAEPLLAARIVAMANSVAYNPYGREISDLRSAISRLGFATLRSLTMALITRQMAGAAIPAEHKALAEQLWEHTAHVAALARVLARRVTQVDAEAALFAGLIHEVPGFYLLSRSQHYPGLLDEDFAEWIETGERLVGQPLLVALDIPENIRLAVEFCWDGYLGMPPSTLGDTLLLAEELSPVPSPLHQIGGQNKFGRIDAEIEIMIGETQLSEILAESREEVASLSAALSF
jgi:HD-like signal output (HDOD) protein